MATPYNAKWVSKQQAQTLRKSGRVGDGVLLDSFNGFILVRPADSNPGDGPKLSRAEADYELQEVWCTGAKAKLARARRLLGLDAEAPAHQLAGSAG